MTMSPMPKVFALLLTVILWSLGTSLALSETPRPLESILVDLERHIAELTINIEKIEKRKEFLQAAPSTKDPMIQQLRDLDLKGWELHQEQWKIQLDHLRFTEGLLRKVQTNPGEKPQLLKTWIDHERKYEADLEAYRTRRQAVEEQRLQTEGKMIEQYFR